MKVLAGGNLQSAAIGEAAGAATGALIGAIVQDSERDRYYHEAPTGGYPYGRPMGSRVLSAALIILTIWSICLDLARLRSRE